MLVDQRVSWVCLVISHDLPMKNPDLSKMMELTPMENPHYFSHEIHLNPKSDG
jgi:hypothetical protein